MKNIEFKKLALLGMTTGLIALGQTGVIAESNSEVMEDCNSICLDNIMAKSKCETHGCGAPTVEAEVKGDSDKNEKTHHAEVAPVKKAETEEDVKEAPAKE